MSEVREDNEIYDEINIVPMLDLAYVLLVIFIILTTATVQGIMINLPKASAQPSLAESRTKAITIRDDGSIFLDTYPVTLTELQAPADSAVISLAARVGKTRLIDNALLGMDVSQLS